MYRNHAVGVVVPAYNEEGFVGDVIDTAPAFVDRVYAVDDPETDGGRATLVAPDPGDGAESDTRVVAVRLPENRGVGGAITAGYRRALDDGMDVVAVMNGDGQMDPDALDRVLDPVVEGRAAYVKGNRLETGSDREGMSRWRTFGNGILTVLTRTASGYWGVTDPQNGYTAISREALESLDLDALYEEYGFCNDLLAALNRQGARVVDVSLPAKYGDEESDIRYGSFVPGLSVLLGRHFLTRLWERYLFEEFHPLVLLYPFGAVVGGVGALEVLRGDRRGNAVVLFVLGAFSVLLALTFDREAERARRARVTRERRDEAE